MSMHTVKCKCAEQDFQRIGIKLHTMADYFPSTYDLTNLLIWQRISLIYLIYAGQIV